MSEQQTNAELFEDRNLLALAFATAINELAEADPHDRPDMGACWYRPPNEDDADAGEWAIVQVAIPSGQTSWHIPRNLAQQSDVPNGTRDPYDGHTRDDTNSRLYVYVSQ